MKQIASLGILFLLLISCSQPKKEETAKKKDEEIKANHNDVRKPFTELEAKKFYEGIRKEGTDKEYKFRVDSIGTDQMTMFGVSLFGEEPEVSGLAMSATSDSAMVYLIGDKLVIELYDGVANFFNQDQLTKTESFIKKEYRFNMKDIQLTKKYPKKTEQPNK
ncbi:MAG: hypothetical protein R2799_07740 [Crocinitomicaceae bacterium]